MMRGVPGDSAKPLVPAVCRCGHQGRSRYPEHYRCGACYYMARMRANIQKADQLRRWANELETQAWDFQAKAMGFKERHPGAGEV